MRSIAIAVTTAVLVASLSVAALAVPPAATVENLLDSERTVLDQPFSYPQGDARITAAVVTLAPGASTARHLHAVPLFAYILKGQLIVDYESEGERVYRRGDTLDEAIDWPHRGRNGGKGVVKILVVYAGAVGVPNSEILE